MRPVTSRRDFAAVLGVLVLLAGLDACKETASSRERGRSGEVPELGAVAFYNDYASLKGAALLKKYKDGVVVTGSVNQIVNLGHDEGLQVWLAVEGPGHIAARFQGGGAAARPTRLAVGDEVKLRCQIGGKPEAVLFLSDCTFEPGTPSR